LKNGDHLKISLISTTEELMRLRDAWNALLSRSRSNTVFLTWEWIYSWWNCYGTDKSLYIIVISDRTDEIIGIAPLYITHLFKFGIPIKEIRFIGDGSRDSDYLDFIIRQEKEPESISFILEFLRNHRNEWDIARFNTTPTTSPCLQSLCQESQKNSFILSRDEFFGSFVDLPDSWESYEATLKKKFSRNLRKRTREIQQNHKVEFILCKNKNDLSEQLESLMTLHQKRWQDKDWAGIFSSPIRRRFYSQFTNLLFDNGWLRLYSLKVDDVFVNHQLYMDYANTWYWLIDGFDPDMGKLEVGKVGKGRAFRDAISLGIHTLDFLGSFTLNKRHWGGQPKTLVNLSIFQNRGRSRFVFEASKSVEKIKKSMASAVPDKYIEWSKREIRRILAFVGIRIQ